MTEHHVIEPIAGRISFDDVEKDFGDHTPTAAPTTVEASEESSQQSHAPSAKPEATEPKQPSNVATPHVAPDGGWAAWSVVMGGFITLFCSFGFLNNFAAFQSYYFQHTLRGYSNSDIAWIGSLQVFCILSANLALGPLFDRFGPRPLLIASTFLFTFGCMMTSLADGKYYAILLAQGVVVGISLGAAFITPMACVMMYFDKKRPAALGIVVSGSSIGGVVWPIVTLQLLNHVGYGWTWRILGFIGLALLPISVLTVRLPPHVVEAKKNRPKQAALALEAFKSPRYSMFTVQYCFFGLGLFPLLFYFPELTAHYGVDSSLQFYSISILNAFSFVGRLGLPILAQWTGVYNTTIVTILLCAICSFSFIAIDSAAGSVVAAGAFGFTSGGALSLVVASVPRIIPNFHKLGASMGQIFFISSFFGMLTGPICGWILGTSPTGNWTGVECYVGACLLASVIGLTVIRFTINSKPLAIL